MKNELSAASSEERIPIRILILPKFEIGEMSGDEIGEAQLFYENLFEGCDEYEIKGGYDDHPLYVKNGLALYVTGIGKVNAALSMQAILNDQRFDFSKTCFISVGCAGGAIGECVPGDIVVASGIVDNELGYNTDQQELTGTDKTWFHDSVHDDHAFCQLNEKLVNRAYKVIRNYKPPTTEKTRAAMATSFPDEKWALRDPKVVRGISVTGDQYWKGKHHHEMAIYKCETYGFTDPYVQSEMEDIGIALALKRYGSLDNLLIVRAIVNADVFLIGTSPESLWLDDETENESQEMFDIFPIAMQSEYDAVRMIIEAILTGEFN